MESLGKKMECEKKTEPENTGKRNRWKEFFGKKENSVLIILGGILLMIIAMPTHQKSNDDIISNNFFELDNADGSSIDVLYGSTPEKLEEGTEENMQLSRLKEKYNGNVVGLELRVENLLMQIEGCQNAYVMITFASEDMGNNKKYDYCYCYPEIDGVVVVLQTRDFSAMEEKITYMIQSLFSLDAHKIKVINMKTK